MKPRKTFQQRKDPQCLSGFIQTAAAGHTRWNARRAKTLVKDEDVSDQRTCNNP